MFIVEKIYCMLWIITHIKKQARPKKTRLLLNRKIIFKIKYVF